MQIIATKRVMEYFENAVEIETAYIVKENETVEDLIKRMLGDKLLCSWIYTDFQVKLKIVSDS